MASRLPEMAPPSSASTLVFVGLVLSLVLCFVLAVRRTGGGTAYAAAGAVVWLSVPAGLAHFGVFASLAHTPAFGLPILAFNALAVALAFSPFGTRMAAVTSLRGLIGVQAFRLPLELVLHSWSSSGTLPVQMTYEGHNFDIVTGLLAASLYLAWPWLPERAQRPAALAFSCVGFSLLLMVMSIAVRSAPWALRSYDNEPPILLLFHVPYVWILPVCVTGALFAHLLAFRRLLSRRKARAAPFTQ